MKPRELRDVDVRDVLSGKVELPGGWTRARLLGVVLQIELDQILTHSFIEREGDAALLFLHGQLRGIGKVNSAGKLDGELAILYPNSPAIWIIAQFENGEPCGEWREFTSSGLLLPGKPLEWLTWGEAFREGHDSVLH